MAYYIGPEKRAYPRILGKFVVSYQIKNRDDHTHISQTRNLSKGGMILTTNKNFPVGTVLTIEIRLPFNSEKINLDGQVLDIKEIVKDLIYDARVKFIDLDPKYESIIKETVDYYSKSKK